MFHQARLLAVNVVDPVDFVTGVKSAVAAYETRVTAGSLDKNANVVLLAILPSPLGIRVWLPVA